MADVLQKTGITATCGIGTNLYLTKIALDITAKHVEPGPGGGRIAELDEISYRKTLWEHKPITDFWRIGTGTANTPFSGGVLCYRNPRILSTSALPVDNPVLA